MWSSKASNVERVCGVAMQTVLPFPQGKTLLAHALVKCFHAFTRQTNQGAAADWAPARIHLSDAAQVR